MRCFNHWPWSVEQDARKAGLDGAASCKTRHVKETATVSLAKGGGQAVKVLCTDNFGTGSAQVIELSPNAMKKMSNALEKARVKVCYSGSRQPGLGEWDGALPRRPEVENCMATGCSVPEGTPRLKDIPTTEWPDD